MSAFIPQWRRDTNNIDHKYGFELAAYGNTNGSGIYAFIERHVKYVNKKKKQEHDEVIQVIHLGKPYIRNWVHYPVINSTDLGLLFGHDDDMLDDAYNRIQTAEYVSVELMESISKEYQVYITAVIDDIKYVFSPERTFKSDEGYENG
ncbi:hypothetical protein [Pseudomonas phage PA1C]|uniref:Uncharacterized protein n=1 Tax=Pseudomonas phage vB_PaeM_PS119XW TaxID=2601632 RepID=A0A5C1K953_9CAUD|nr:hypothetical protein PP933_gp344 [Pseudomonas phage vB_PaeM_PS119XW]QBX32500.1 hypothetical protein [Pseudomonas phage PA1C]QEM42073.1 hypothetical protein [Pseudomonas phage vB_PaeM_PS119XW]BEG72587.1 hypothetical protein RVBP21_2150 [Pseudomonas phage BRkr]